MRFSWPPLLLLSVASGLLSAAPVAAEHEVVYRYVVLGYVKDARGNPERGVKVTLVREKTGLAYHGETDAQGLYVIVVRLANEDLGNALRVTADGAAATIRARFDPENRKDERGTRLDFLGKKGVERPTWFPATLKRFLAQ